MKYKERQSSTLATKNPDVCFDTAKPLCALAIERFGSFEVAYRPGTADELVIGHSFDNDAYFTGAPEYKPKPTDAILDIGAHIGTFTLLAASKVPAGRVYAVEASQESFNYLKINLSMNRLHNVDASHLALSDKKGQTVLHLDVENWLHSIMTSGTRHEEIVSTDSLGSFITEKEIERCDFIKFNCEGAEFPILLKTPPEVFKKINKMLVLYHCDLAPKYTSDMLISYLRENSFKVKVRNKTRQRGWIIAERSNTPI